MQTSKSVQKFCQRFAEVARCSTVTENLTPVYPIKNGGIALLWDDIVPVKSSRFADTEDYA